MVTKCWEGWDFSGVRMVAFQLWIYLRLRKLRVEMAHFKKYIAHLVKRGMLLCR